MSEKLLFESLHSHTTLSDGIMTHLEVLDAAERLGLGVVAFTDHDTLPDDTIMAGLRAYTGPVKWTVGVELSSLVPRFVGTAEKGNLHILGLFTDITNRPLQEFCKAAEDSRLRRMKKYVVHLRELGFTISEADILSVATSKTIASPHMVKALWLYPENQMVMERLKGEMKMAAEHDEALAKQYQQAILDGPNQWPYVLFMGGHSFKPAPRTGYEALRPFEDSVDLIREAGGIALQAHWYHDQNKMNVVELETVLKNGGLDGLETAVVNTISDFNIPQEFEQTRELVKKYNLVETVGSDSHTPADMEAFRSSTLAQHSIGQTARLLEKVKPNLAWSDLG